ncbi:hypothetical protein MNBD_GAMMA12-3622 [hydrothermal vent metagenome]|uniref:Uncharacterized protein n=1 Tax=hydrothermal vent metagenome TaxID=652676 RepID=A0A3B0Y2R5_9ZZZZ
MTKLVSLIIGLFSANIIYSQELSKSQLDQWLNNPDAPIPLVKKNRKINEGKLTFLDPSKHKNVMHSDNNIRIDAQSLKTGWVELRQCYRNLDAFPRVQIVYKYRNIRHLKIKSVKKIKSAKIEGRSVQLVDVQKGALLCISAQIQSLQKTVTGYQLQNGPFRRKFLDGYFPLHVTVNVRFPNLQITLESIKPKSVQGTKFLGIQVSKSINRVTLNALFEGVLNTQLNFTLVANLRHRNNKIVNQKK